MHPLIAPILRALANFLQNVADLLEERPTPSPGALSETTTTLSPRPLTPATTTFEETPSPSTWRQEKTSNTELRTEYRQTGTCPHYCHHVPRSTLDTCPVCLKVPSFRKTSI
jgi:hypothetical protein